MEIIDEGYVTLKVRDSEGREHAAQVDLFEFTAAVDDVIRDALRKEGPGQDSAFYQGVGDLLVQAGLPRLSGGAIQELIARMRQAKEEFKKKHLAAPSPGSPASTASTPGS